MDKKSVPGAQLAKNPVAETYDLVVLGSGTGSKVIPYRLFYEFRLRILTNYPQG